MSPVPQNPVDGITERPADRQDREAFRIETSVFIFHIGAPSGSGPGRDPRLHQVSLSATGMGLATHERLFTGQRIMLEFALPPQMHQRLYAHAHVVYAAPRGDGTFGVGLKFEWLSSEDERRLREYCLAEERCFLRKELEKIGY